MHNLSIAAKVRKNIFDKLPKIFDDIRSWNKI